MSVGADATFSTFDNPPEAFADEIYLDPTSGMPVTIDALANDTDGDGDALTITKVSRARVGTVAIAGNKLTYTPGAHFAAAGSDSVTYTVSDGFGKTATATVTINASLFALRAGKFGGVINAADQTVHGVFTLMLTKTGGLSYSATIDGITQSGHGTFTSMGDFTSADQTVTFHLDLTPATASFGSFALTGTIGNGLTMTGAHAAYAATEVPREAGKYTVLITPDATQSPSPQATGYGTLTVLKGGQATLAGKLADGTAFSASAPLTGATTGHNQLIVLNQLIYSRKGLLDGAVVFASQTDRDASGTLTWRKPPAPGAYYAPGFTAHVTVQAASYAAPRAGTGVLPFSTGSCTISGGRLASSIVETVTISLTNSVSITGADPASVKLHLTPSTGAFSGSFIPTAGSKAISLQGILYQNANIPQATGYFLGPVANGIGLSGTVTIAP